MDIDPHKNERLLFCPFCNPQWKPITHFVPRSLALQNSWEPVQAEILIDLGAANTLEDNNYKAQCPNSPWMRLNRTAEFYLILICPYQLVMLQTVAEYFNLTSALKYYSKQHVHRSPQFSVKFFDQFSHRFSSYEFLLRIFSGIGGPDLFYCLPTYQERDTLSKFSSWVLPFAKWVCACIALTIGIGSVVILPKDNKLRVAGVFDNCCKFLREFVRSPSGSHVIIRFASAAIMLLIFSYENSITCPNFKNFLQVR